MTEAHTDDSALCRQLAERMTDESRGYTPGDPRQAADVERYLFDLNATLATDAESLDYQRNLLREAATAPAETDPEVFEGVYRTLVRNGRIMRVGALFGKSLNDIARTFETYTRYRRFAESSAMEMSAEPAFYEMDEILGAWQNLEKNGQYGPAMSAFGSEEELESTIREQRKFVLQRMSEVGVTAKDEYESNPEAWDKYSDACDQKFLEDLASLDSRPLHTELGQGSVDTKMSDDGKPGSSRPA